jgi:hypothetical protein
MIKYSLVLIHFVGLYFAGLFTEPTVNVTALLPTALASGEKTLVSVSIEKSGTSGFAKLELVLPYGLVATPSETNGASFTFSSQKAKFIWMALPEEDAFTVSYYLEALPDANGQLEVSGIFSYIKENQRADFNITPRSVLVTPSQSLATNIAETETGAEGASGNQLVPLLPDNAVGCSRLIEKISDTEFVVKLSVNQNNIHGFAKILETLPLNCKAEKLSDGGAVVTADEQTIKFVWFDIPQQPNIEVSYRMNCVLPIEGQPSINGKMSYIDNSAPAEMVVTNKGMVVVGDMAQVPPAEEPREEPARAAEVPSQPVKPAETPAQVVKPAEIANEISTEIADNAVRNAEIPTPPVKILEPAKETRPAPTSIPAPESGITYKVQILAAHRVVGKTYFSSVHRYSEKFDIENHDGWVKYTTGKYSDYKQARDTRERLRSYYETLPGPFVTAYNDGERITVQEALLISKQQWYQ